VSHVLTPPALTAILQDPAHRVHAFLGPGHVCSVMGTREYEPIAARYRVPIIITGSSRSTCSKACGAPCTGSRRMSPAWKTNIAGSQCSRQRRFAGVARARVRGLRSQVAGIGLLPKSGLRLRYEYHAHDALRVFEVDDILTEEPAECISGQVLRG